MDRNDRGRPRRDFRGPVQQIPVRAIAGLAALAVCVAAVLWLVFSSFYTIQADEQGVVLRLGRYLDPPAEPGLHFKLPFGIDSVYPVKVKRIETLAFGFRPYGSDRDGRTRYESVPDESLMLTGDQNVVDVEWIIQYRIREPSKWLFRIKDPVGTLRDVSQAAMRLVVGDSSATEILTERRREVATEVRRSLQETLDSYDAGVEIVTVELQNVIPPTKQVQDAFNEVNRARQDKEKRINEANREYMKAIPEAEGEARKVVQEAEGYKLKRVNEAQGDVAKFAKLVSEYESSKEVTRQRLYLEAMEEVLPRLTRIYVVEPSSGAPLQILDLEAAAGSSGARRSAAAMDPASSAAPSVEAR